LNFLKKIWQQRTQKNQFNDALFVTQNSFNSQIHKASTSSKKKMEALATSDKAHFTA